MAEAFCALGYSSSAVDPDHTHPRRTIMDHWGRWCKPTLLLPSNLLNK